MSMHQPLIHDVPGNSAAPVRALAVATPASAASLLAQTAEAARTVNQTTHRWADVAATLTEITRGVLAAVAAAQYASIAWAGGRWLTGQAPTDPVVATLDALQATSGKDPAWTHCASSAP